MDRLVGLTEETRKLALDRFHVLRPHLEENQPLRLVAAAAGMLFRTAQRWVALYRQSGLTALARRKRADRGEHRSVSANIRKAIEGLALQKPPLPIAALYRQVRRLAADRGEEPPSYLGGLSHRPRLAERLFDAGPSGHQGLRPRIRFGLPARGGRPERDLAG